MKKRIFAILMILLMAASCAKKGIDPAELLHHVYQKHKDLSSYTADGLININLGSADGSSMTMPLKMTIMYDNQGNQDVADDQVYVDMNVTVMDQKLNYQMWVKDGKLYSDDGTNKTVSALDDFGEAMQSYAQIDVTESVKLLTDHLESFSANPKDQGVELVLKPKDSFFSDLLSSNLFSQLDQLENSELASLKELMKGLKMSDIVLTIDENELLSDLNTALSMNYEEVDLLADMNLKFRDFDQTTIPFFNEADFSEGNIDYEDLIDVDDDGDYDDYDGSYIDIVFDDNATEIYIYMNDADRYAIYYDDNEYMISVYDGTDVAADGLFISKDFANDIWNEFQNNKTDFAVRSIEQIDASFTDGSVMIGYSFTDNDYFNPDTPFSLITFDGCQYAVVFVGYGTEQQFKDFMDQTGYMIYIQE